MKLYWLVSVVYLSFVTGENILAIFPNSARSHYYFFENLIIELANRGHHVVVVNQFPQEQKVQNFTHVLLPPVGQSIIKEVSDLRFYNPKNLTSVFGLMYLFFEFLAEFDAIVLEETLELLKDSYKFDLIITETFNTDLFLGFAHKYQAPIVALSSTYFFPWNTDRFGIPYGIDVKGEIPFHQRLGYLVGNFVLKTVYNYHYIEKLDQTGRKYFGQDMPSLGELAKKTSLILVNTHYSFNVPRSFPPQVIEVSGMHVKPIKPLPQDIEEFLNESKHGVIYFSFGSIVRSSTMPEDKVKAFCDAFSQLPQRVLWKWENQEMPGKPDNVKLVQWSPQRDVLAHPNVKMFISHGGLLGTIEAVHSGVPMIGIPFFGDQGMNIDNMVNMEVAIHLDYFNITKESVLYAVTTLLEDRKYIENARRLSQIYKDRPQSPLETAVFWTEYVLRHKGAHHLRSAAVNQPWYQYFLLDVIGFLLGVAVSACLVLFYTVKFIFRKIFVSNKKHKIQ